MNSSQYTRIRVESHTEVLPYVSIRIPRLSPPPTSPALSHTHDAHKNCDASYPTCPRFLPLPITFLLLLFFILLTSLACGMNGWNHITTQITGHALVPDFWPTATSVDPSSSQAVHRAALVAAREAKQQRRATQFDGPGQGQSWIAYLTLASLPPLNAEPFSCLITHEYTSLAIFLIRVLICRTMWHILLWWHLLCATVSIIEIIRWRIQQRKESSSIEGISSNIAPVPSAPILLLHTVYWCTNALIFGWPVVYLLRQQLHSKRKAP